MAVLKTTQQRMGVSLCVIWMRQWRHTVECHEAEEFQTDGDVTLKAR